MINTLYSKLANQNSEPSHTSTLNITQRLNSVHEIVRRKREVKAQKRTSL